MVEVLEFLNAKSSLADLEEYASRSVHKVLYDSLVLCCCTCELTLESRILLKELLFLCAVRLFSSTRIAKIRNQSDRNIRKVRGTMLKKIRKKLLPALLDKAEKQQPMTLLEKDFLEENMAEIDSEEKK